MTDEAQMLREFKQWMDFYSPDWMRHFTPGEIEPLRKCWFAATEKAHRPEVDAPVGGESWLRAQRDTAEERLADTAKAVKAAAKMIEDGMHCSAQLDLEVLAGKLEKYVPSPRKTQSD